MTAMSETSLNRQQPTSPTETPAPLASKAKDVLSRVRVALGGRDFKGEVQGLAIALKHANQQQAGAIVDQLLELIESPAASDALSVMAGVFARLDSAKADRVIAAGHGLWPRAFEITLIDPDPACRASLAALIGRLADPETVPLLGVLLRDSNAGVAQAAAKAIVSLADRLTAEPRLDPPARQVVHHLIAAGVETFDQHRQRDALGALLILCSAPAAIRGIAPTLSHWLGDPQHPAHLVLRGMIRRGDAFATREAAWTLIALESYRAACADRLSMEADAAAHARVLALGHLLLNPARSSALAAARSTARRGHAPGLEIGPEIVDELDDAAARFAPAWAAGIAPETLVASIESLLANSSPRTRLNSIRAIDEQPLTPELAGLLADLALDPDERVARSALARVASPQTREALGVRGVTTTIHALRRAASPRVREIAELHAAALTPSADDAAGVLIARRLLRADRQKFTGEMHARLRHADAGVRLDAIRLVQLLRIGAAFELELLAMISQSTNLDVADPAHAGVLRCAASAVSVLADLPSPAAHHAVQKCLHHADARVRANALDALARTARRRGSIADPSTPLAAAIVEFKKDPAHRVRAGATRAALLAEGAEHDLTRSTITTLSPMLTDERPMHRVSGLWLAERIVVRAGASERFDQPAADALAGTIADLVRSDPDPEVRIRARQTASRVLAAMRSGWADRAKAI